MAEFPQPLSSRLSERVFLLSRRWNHHSDHSGYDRLGSFVGRPLAAKPISERLLPDRFMPRVMRGMAGYDRGGVALELLATQHMALHRDCLYHVLYGDNCYNYLGQLDGWRGHRVVASFHHPPRKFADWVGAKETVSRLSAAILLGNNQYPSFQGLLPPERLFRVPYAVETDFFTPPAEFSERRSHLCLFVGAHLRDFETLRLVIEDAKILAPDLEFRLVVRPDDLREFQGLAGNFVIHTDLTESDLLGLYQSATLLIEPLVDAVANTAVLEGMACGLPMVLSDVGAVRDYVDEDSASLVPPFNAQAMLFEIIDLVNNPARRRRMSICARERALEFDWRQVARQMSRVYEHILA